MESTGVGGQHRRLPELLRLPAQVTRAWTSSIRLDVIPKTSHAGRDR